MGKLVSVPSHPNYCCCRTFSLLQQTLCSGSKAAPQPGSRHGRGSSSPWGNPRPRCPGEEGQGHSCVPLRWLHSTPSCQQPSGGPWEREGEREGDFSGERRRLFPLGMLCPAKPSAAVAVQPCRERGCPWKNCPRNANPWDFSYCPRGER